MAHSAHELDEVYPAEPRSVGRARSDLARFAASVGATSLQLDDVRLAVSEAVTNSLQHGYRGGPGRVEIAAGVIEGELWIVVRDSGCGMQLATDRPGLGLGLGLIAQISDQMTVVPRPEGGTELRMSFGPCDGTPAAQAGGDAAVATVAYAAPANT